VVYDEALANRVRAVLAGQPGVEEKRMFGGLSFMVGGQMCCGVLKDDLVVRVGAEHFDYAMAQPHVRAFDFTGRPSTGMVYVSRDGLPNEQVLTEWVQRGVDYTTVHPRLAKRTTRR
jgi:TfoX/Sxy family transcriptional regulator of competence genes